MVTKKSTSAHGNKKPVPKSKVTSKATPKVNPKTKSIPVVTSVPTECEKPSYWQEACEHLSANDRVMRRLIPCFQNESLASRGDPFVTLARSIVGQQISVPAAQAVWERVDALHPEFVPDCVLQTSVEALRGAGLSARKVDYLRDLALHFKRGDLHEKVWLEQPDEAVIASLVAVRGIGRWTAEMFLMFHSMRPNILPLDDVGLIKGISKNYFSGEAVSRSEAKEVAKAWEPFCSVATWFIWRSLDPYPVSY